MTTQKTTTIKTWNLGYPRIGRKRDLKKALEAYWSKTIPVEDLEATAKKICLTRWKRQNELGVDSIPLNDFSFYDQMLDMTWLLGAIPGRFKNVPKSHWLDQYFAMARGYRDASQDVAALDMTKWFNTNYHYLRPEIDSSTTFSLQWNKVNLEFDHAAKQNFSFHPVLIGPWTYVRLSNLTGVTANEVLKKIVPLYVDILKTFKSKGYQKVQIDEPGLCTDLVKEDLQTVKGIYEELNKAGTSLMLTTYFESPAPWLSEVAALPVAGIHLDLVYGKETLKWLKTKSFPAGKILSLGVVNGRNLWVSPLNSVRTEIEEIRKLYPTHEITLAPSCSLLHLPHDRTLEKKWDSEFASWIAFADQRLEEINYLKRALEGDKTVESIFDERERVMKNRSTSPRIHRSDVKQAVESIDASMKTRTSPFETRIAKQQQTLKLPSLPTTTIGSFPQTTDIRHIRQEWKKGSLTTVEYNKFLEKEIERVIRLQESVGLDVLVHGEPERNDMVEYFGELLEGFAFSDHGWVQSYGSRCVKPPIIFGDVKRKAPMTVSWFKFAQSLTNRPVKGMLTGPVTILNWSFVREDQSRETTTFQIALAIRDEVKDLESHGARIIQIDEAAIREGLPIKRADWKNYLKWATESFRVSAGAVKDETQIQTHMCYSEFADMMDSIRDLDADVLLIENARSGSTFFGCFKEHPYQNQIGPGVYDIHSPRVPTAKECETSIKQILTLFPAKQVWINPDCGLKTRKYEEVEPALQNMVEGTKNVRAQIK
jgi:5-methyltetrahydropteroyltriglutamate--homocysteine methyltransferase